ncbi:flagellar hook-associated protein FlgK [Chachezhania sediminis]|uniref:flagellar hook-associated protein FlgK n=1 Tax=Chachezhania sediminis TaxID=2599291 RepID=UPI00131DC770|nr:flagellar hook-associated protein FlgK [Chachezhania sediminis]
MSLSTALNNAMTGLAAAGRATAVVSDNISNALTPGYGRRSLDLASASVTGGVRFVGITRNVDPVMVSNRRVADAEESNFSALSRYHDAMVRVVGSATEGDSLAARVSGFESSLFEAQSRPDSIHRLDSVVSQASLLAEGLNDASAGLRAERSRADRSIGIQVTRANEILGRIQLLNTRITSIEVSGGDSNGMRDERQVLLDELNTIIPIQEVTRENGQIAIYTTTGSRMLDGVAATIGFSVVGETTPYMTVDNGLLSGLTINDKPVTTLSASSAIAGGSLAAAFEIRDKLAVEMQSDLDSMARDLIERFQTPGLDPTAAIGDPGLFTDEGAAFDPLDELDIASRISVNTIIDPAQGGDSTYLRDGFGAAMPGDVGYAGQLQAFADIMSDGRVPASGRFGSVALTASGLAASLMSRVSQGADYAGQRLSFASASRTELQRIELAEGVDTDAEMQTLIVVEQIYAANARMIAAVDEMMDTLLRI